MLKTGEILENISRALLNLGKGLMFVIFKDSANFHAVNIHIFSLVHQLQLLLVLNFVFLSHVFG